MPYYSFGCQDCGTRFRTFLKYDEYGTKKIRCPKCKSEKIARRISRVRMLKSEESRMESLESLADPSALEGLEDDPVSMGRMMRKMKDEMGEELGPEFDEVVNRLERGQSPDEIEASMPELGEEMGDGGGFGGGEFDDF